MWKLFLLVAGAHFLALLSPGPDFFLVLRGALRVGWRRASGICVGIAAANAVYIALALGGFAVLRAGGPAFRAVQGAGALYLVWLGWRFWCAPPQALALPGGAGATVAGAAPAFGWWRGWAMGLASGLLNPKNALFYASLFAVLGSARAPLALQWACAVWMVAAVLAWDLAVAALVGRRAVLARLARHLPWIERACGALLLALGLGMAWQLLYIQ